MKLGIAYMKAIIVNNNDVISFHLGIFCTTNLLLILLCNLGFFYLFLTTHNIRYRAFKHLNLNILCYLYLNCVITIINLGYCSKNSARSHYAFTFLYTTN